MLSSCVCTAVGRPPVAACRNPDKLQPLRTRLKRLAASASESPPPQQQQPQPQSFLSDEERSTLSPSQLEFVERKRRAAAGLGPVFPESSRCGGCGGSGLAPCHACGGTGINAAEKAEELFDNERGLVVQNNGMPMQFFFQKDCPCWLCRGSATIGCIDCGGKGFAGEGFDGD